MTYLEAVALLQKIESHYDIMSIKYKGVSIWPLFRLRLLDTISVNKETKVSWNIVKIVIRSLFFGHPFRIFKKHDVWAFTDAERRKNVGGCMIHRISGGLSNLPISMLMIEKPSSYYGHPNKSKIDEKNILSESWLFSITYLFMFFSRVKKSQIENVELLEKILYNNDLSFDYLFYLRRMDAQRKSMRFFLSIARKPRLILFECPYSSMGYLWAFHDKGIRTIEMQHGVINHNHNAYNANLYEPILNPDGICVFGIEEFNFFKRESPNYTNIIEMTGLYMLDMADKYFKQDIFHEYRKIYKNIAVVSGQAGFEKQLGMFLDSVASNHLDTYFVYIPRNNDVKLFFTNSNIKLTPNVNIYEYIKWSDIHITISSTTCLESHYFHKPTIFYDYQKMASSYYGSVLMRENAVEYVEDSKSFTNAFYNLLVGNFKYKDIFAHGHSEKLYNVIMNNIC